MFNSNKITNVHGETLDTSFHPADQRDVLVIIGHGVTGNKDRPLLIALAEGLAQSGWPCLRFSFSGNGDSEGRFQEVTISKEIEDLRAILDSVPAEVRIAYVGHSMGAAVGVLTAADDIRIQSLVSLAGMTHTAEFVDREFGNVVPDAGFMWDQNECPLSSIYVNDLKTIGSTLEVAERILQPWLLIHGTADDIVPLGDSLDAFAAATCAKHLIEIPGASHLFDERSYPVIIEAVHGWLQQSFGIS